MEGFRKAQVSSWVAAALRDAGFDEHDITEVIGAAWLKKKVIGAAWPELTLEQMMQDGIPHGPAVLLAKKIQLLKGPRHGWRIVCCFRGVFPWRWKWKLSAKRRF